MSISSVSSPIAATPTQAADATQSTSSTAQAGSSSDASSAGHSGSSSKKTVVSEVSFTIDGITTTTITYSDGSAEVIQTAASSTGGSKGAQTYNAQGLTQTATSSGTTAPSQGVTAG